jgi:hypothetical protein
MINEMANKKPKDITKTPQPVISWSVPLPQAGFDFVSKPVNATRPAFAITASGNARKTSKPLFQKDRS